MLAVIERKTNFFIKRRFWCWGYYFDAGWKTNWEDFP